MTAQFELRLMGADAPQGELDADDLLAIVSSLKEVATKIGRVQTDAEPTGRPPRRVERVAGLSIGLLPGSTRIRFRRRGSGTDALPFDLADEKAFDDELRSLVDSIAADERPDWVGDSLSLAAFALTAALQHAAPEVELTVDGKVLRRFRTADISRETWQLEDARGANEVTFVGRLYAVNLNTHRLQVQDDVGHQVALPRVHDDAEVASLIGCYVTVMGSPTRDSRGRLTQIREARISEAADPPGATPLAARTLAEILGSAPGPELGSIDLTDEEFASFMAATGRCARPGRPCSTPTPTACCSCGARRPTRGCPSGTTCWSVDGS